MNARLKALIASLFAALLVIASGQYFESIDLRRAVEKQADEAAAELEIMTSRVSRDLTQSVGVLQGVNALMSSSAVVTQEAFSSFVAPHLRENPSIRRIFMVKDGRVSHVAPFTTVPAVFGRIEQRAVASDPLIERARTRNVPALVGPATFADVRYRLAYGLAAILSGELTFRAREGEKRVSGNVTLDTGRAATSASPGAADRSTAKRSAFIGRLRRRPASRRPAHHSRGRQARRAAP
jgi:hypothetical protein